MIPLHSYYVGVDLGQSQDYTAIAVLEEPVWIPSEEARCSLNAPAVGWNTPDTLVPAQLARARDLEYYHGGRPDRPALAVRHLERLPLGTRYYTIVERVLRLVAAPPLAGREPVLVVDHTGVGRGIVDLFRRQTPIVAITITGGDAITREDDNLRVPKRDLIGAVSVLLEGRRLKIAQELPEAATLVKELNGFQRRVTKTGHDTYEAWREGQHDDLVLAVALAGWYREWWNTWLDRRGTTGSINYLDLERVT